jgi:hypothetical protein
VITQLVRRRRNTLAAPDFGESIHTLTGIYRHPAAVQASSVQLAFTALSW